MLCQQRAIDLFQQSIANNRLGHAYIFAGDDGVGRFLMAQQWAKALLCAEPVNGEFFDSCGECRSCKLFDSGNHPDFKHIYKELIQYSKDSSNAKKTPTNFPIDVVREFFVDVAANKPQMSQKVVYVISEAEKMLAPAQNAMLKTLEEPPPYCLIILLCSRTDRLLPTILSRSQVVRFSPIDEDIIVQRLAAKNVDHAQSLFWARFTSGSLGAALTYCDLAEKCDCYRIKCRLVEQIASLKLASSLDIAEWIVAQSADMTAALGDILKDVSKSDVKKRCQKMLLKMLLSLGSDVIRVHISQDNAIVHTDQLGLVRSLSSQLGVDEAAKYVEKTNLSMTWVDANVNEKLIFEDNLLHLAKLKS